MGLCVSLRSLEATLFELLRTSSFLTQELDLACHQVDHVLKRPWPPYRRTLKDSSAFQQLDSKTHIVWDKLPHCSLDLWPQSYLSLHRVVSETGVLYYPLLSVSSHYHNLGSRPLTAGCSVVNYRTHLSPPIALCGIFYSHGFISSLNNSSSHLNTVSLSLPNLFQLKETGRETVWRIYIGTGRVNSGESLAKRRAGKDLHLFMPRSRISILDEKPRSRYAIQYSSHAAGMSAGKPRGERLAAPVLRLEEERHVCVCGCFTYRTAVECNLAKGKLRTTVNIAGADPAFYNDVEFF
ncbi:hypothetical protein J6590_044091 [Homalodisca vitripennis]|nr:hypothetical protein J6590_044091 [Homalodisca vitripennis]